MGSKQPRFILHELWEKLEALSEEKKENVFQTMWDETKAENRKTTKDAEEKQLLIWRVISGMLLLCSIVLAVLLVRSKEESEYYRGEHRWILNNYVELEDKMELMEQQITFMNDYVAIINADDGSNLYHTYDCEDWRNADGSWSIYVYNIKAALNAGYLPCEKCYPLE